MGKRCFIVGAGEFSKQWFPGDDDYVIAADAGYAQLVSVDIIPDLVVGDFDSLGAPPIHPNILRSPAEKDDTDLMLAVKCGLERGFSSFIIDGGLGGRLDQTFANFQILTYLAEKDTFAVLLGREICVTAVRNGDICFSPGLGMKERLISVFSAGDKAVGVTLTGLKYPLDNATLTFDYPLGVSNEFTDAAAVVSVRSGTLLVIWSGGFDRLIF